MRISLEDSGFQILDTMLGRSELDAISARLHDTPAGKAGSRRLLEHAWCRQLAEGLREHLVPVQLLAPDHIPVQCTYFEKSTDRNWLVPLHQDLSIPVRARVDDAGLSGWSEKEGTLFVQPPGDVLERLLALRLHLDPCGPHDGALKVVPGSHRFGRVSVAQESELRAAHGETLCPVPTGGVMAIRPLLLHASSKAEGSSRRRVLHFVFGPPTLPLGLQWPAAVLDGA